MLSVNLRFSDVSFSYLSGLDPVIKNLNCQFSKGWTGIVGPNGSGKSTIGKLASGLIKSDRGTIHWNGSGFFLYSSQVPEIIPDHSYDFLYSEENRSGEICSLLEIQNDWLDRWENLSFGERKRFQMAVYLFLNPEVLVLDEPGNHLDVYSKKLLLNSLSYYSGVGILISHDRELLDELCESCLLYEAGKFIQRPGGYSRASELQQMENKSMKAMYKSSLQNWQKIKKSHHILKQKEIRGNAFLSKKNISKKDHDSKSKIDHARISGKEKIGARKVKLLEKREQKLEKQTENLYKKEFKVYSFGISGEVRKSDSIWSWDLEKMQINEGLEISIPYISILPSNRIGIIGENGAGKSSLLKTIHYELNNHLEKIFYMPQELEEDYWSEIQKRINRLDSKNRGELISFVQRLGSNPDRILDSKNLSPGEKRKLLMGLELIKNPFLLLLDEPTNHLDIPSIEMLENALDSYSGALVIVSHDLRFLSKTCNKFWYVSKKSKLLKESLIIQEDWLLRSDQ